MPEIPRSSMTSQSPQPIDDHPQPLLKTIGESAILPHFCQPIPPVKSRQHDLAPIKHLDQLPFLKRQLSNHSIMLQCTIPSCFVCWEQTSQ